MHGRHLPPDHSKGDANTLGGYMAVHDRPAAFGGSDGFSYSAEIVADETGDVKRPFGAYLLFVRWARIGSASPAGHLESDFVAYGATAGDAVRAPPREPKGVAGRPDARRGGRPAEAPLVGRHARRGRRRPGMPVRGTVL